MEFTGREGSVITLKEAKELVLAFRDTSPLGSVMSYAVGEDLIQQILSQKDCRGLRMYNAKKENGDATLVFVGVNHLGQDLYNGIIVDKIITCPPFCHDSPLNSNLVREELLVNWN